jgi:hypothetical protein
MQGEGADRSVKVGSEGSRFLERGVANLIRTHNLITSALLTWRR